PICSPATFHFSSVASRLVSFTRHLPYKIDAIEIGWWFVGGLVWGVIGDLGHAMANVLGYRDPFWFDRLAWWVPPEFGLGGVLVGVISPVAVLMIVHGLRRMVMGKHRGDDNDTNSH